MFYIMADTTDGITRTLMVDPVSGSFRFQNLSELWTVPVVTPTLPTETRSGCHPLQLVQRISSQMPPRCRVS